MGEELGEGFREQREGGECGDGFQEMAAIHGGYSTAELGWVQGIGRVDWRVLEWRAMDSMVAEEPYIVGEVRV